MGQHIPPEGLTSSLPSSLGAGHSRAILTLPGSCVHCLWGFQPPWEQRAAPSRSGAAKPGAGAELSSRSHGRSCLDCLGVCPGGSRCIWGMGPGPRGAWPPGPRTKGAHCHWPSSSSLSGSPSVRPGLEDWGTIHHHPSFTRKAAGDGTEAVQFCLAAAPAGDAVQRPPACEPVVDGGRLPLREGELILVCFYLLFSDFCPLPLSLRRK